MSWILQVVPGRAKYYWAIYC